jgi:2-polyprenyl-3-methyl-5-hydroxy-6-metoxy-1,4-benzoquinol methylase
MPDATFNPEAAARLVAQSSADFAGAMVSALIYAGDRLGIFDVLSDGKPRTSEILAVDSGLNERYLREWASTLVASGYLDYDPQARAYSMTPEQVAVLADRGSPFYFGGGFLYAEACVRQLPALMQAFRQGGGVSFADFGPEISEAIEGLFANGYREAVVKQWIPAVPGLGARLLAGARVGEVGCGGGHPLISVALAYPAALCTGYDLDPVSLERARTTAADAGVSDRVTFELHAAEDLTVDEQFDLIMAFNCIHDMAQPVAALRGIRRALRPDGTFLWSEARTSDRVEENIGPLGRTVYAASAMHCMTVSLASGGMGLGAIVGEQTVRQLAQEAGFASCEPLNVEHAYHRVYALTK